MDRPKGAAAYLADTATGHHKYIATEGANHEPPEFDRRGLERAIP